ncbi:MAG: hypothetical protein VX272_06545, partial [Planctomycetota bacterium]|nr:hypothetical protein [Planctomycetota bacterium]
MKTLFSLSFCCFLFVLSGLMTSCGKPTSKQEPAVIPAKPAVETPVEASGEPKGEKPVANPEASAVAAPKKEPVAAPTKPEAEKPVEKSEVSKSTAALDKAQLEQAAKAIAETDRRAAEKKNAPKPKVLEAAEYLPVVEVTVKQHTYFEYNTGMSGD